MHETPSELNPIPEDVPTEDEFATQEVEVVRLDPVSDALVGEIPPSLQQMVGFDASFGGRAFTYAGERDELMQDRMGMFKVTLANGVIGHGFVIADGHRYWGGHMAEMVVSQTKQAFAQNSDFTQDKVKETLDGLPQQMAHPLDQNTDIQIDEKNKTGGTTWTCVIINPESKTAIIGHIGDSKVVTYQENNYGEDPNIAQVTSDHTWEELLKGRGVTNAQILKENRHKLYKNIPGFSNPEGENNLTCDITEISLAEIDYLIIGSDGLYSQLDENFQETLQQILSSNDSLENKTKLLVTHGVKRTNDNATAVIVSLNKN